MKRSILVVVLVIALAGLLDGCGGHAPPGEACLAGLAGHDIDYRPVEIDNPRDSRCTVEAPVRVRRIEAALNRPVTMSCGLAERLDEFEHDVVQPIARSEYVLITPKAGHYSPLCPQTRSRPAAPVKFR